MKLLYLAHRIPYPPNKGDKIRSYHELCAFIERGHEVHLLAFADEISDLSYQVDLAHLCASTQIVPLHRNAAKLRAMTSLLINRPFSLGYFASQKMKSLVKRSIAEHEFDAIFVYSSSMAQYAPQELLSRAIMDLVDMDSEKWRDYARLKRGAWAWLYELEWKRLRKYEHAIVSRFAYTIVTTQREASLLSELDEFTRHARLRVITNGVDLDEYYAEGRMIRLTSPRLVFVGAMDYYANVDGARWFVEEILPLIREREPRTEFFIVGANPTREVKKLGERQGVTVTGYVDDVRPYLQAATACVVPLRIARGVQNKLLEAMAAGRAIVATKEAAAGLCVEDGEQLLVAQTSRAFADAVIRVIREEPLRKNLAARARHFVEIHHDWAPLLNEAVRLTESMVARNSAKPGEKNHWNAECGMRNAE
jgi:sugar transferase (PEP-CTERM/EpsH1 system associated)